jgi:hypothetical protein
MPRRVADQGRSTTSVLHSELTHTDPDGRVDGVRAPAEPAKRQCVVHDPG